MRMQGASVMCVMASEHAKIQDNENCFPNLVRILKSHTRRCLEINGRIDIPTSFIGNQYILRYRLEARFREMGREMQQDPIGYCLRDRTVI